MKKNLEQAAGNAKAFPKGEGLWDTLTSCRFRLPE